MYLLMSSSPGTPPASFNLRKSLLIFGSVLLAGLLLLVAVSEFSTPGAARFRGSVSKILQATPTGWSRQEVPIAASSAALASAQGILNFSQASQAVYTRGGVQVVIYAAYWSPGKVSVVDAGSHNPDSCWVNNGCVRSERQYAVAGKIGSRELIPYEYGQYIMPRGGKQNVAFWHLVNGRANRYEDQKAGWRDGLAGRWERLPLLMKDIRAYGINQKSEQMFIRVSSNLPIADLISDPANAELLNTLAPLGVFADQTWQ
jgi:hypothetical protein